MKALLVSGDHALLATLCAAGFNAETVEDGEEALEMARHYGFDLIVAEDDMADMTGKRLARRLREGQVKTPLVLVTNDPQDDEIVAALNAGADDVLVRPIDREVFAARVASIVRRSMGHASATIAIGSLVIDTGAKLARVDGLIIHLTGKEYATLHALALRRDQTMTKEALLDQLYAGRDEPELKIIDVFICKLRRKLGSAGPHVETVWGRGYRLSSTINDRAAKAVLDPDRQTPTPVRMRTLEAVMSRPLSFSEVYSTAGAANESHVRNALATLMLSGLVANIGRPRSAIYQITPSGRAWLIARQSRAAA